MTLVELFTKSPFKMSIISINNSEFMTISAINNRDFEFVFNAWFELYRSFMYNVSFQCHYYYFLKRQHIWFLLIGRLSLYFFFMFTDIYLS